jgi:hypothetical protein
MSRDEALQSLVWLTIFEKAWRRQMKVYHVGGWVAQLKDFASGGTFTFPNTLRILNPTHHLPQPRAMPTSSNISKQLLLCESTVEVQ